MAPKCCGKGRGSLLTMFSLVIYGEGAWPRTSRVSYLEQWLDLRLQKGLSDCGAQSLGWFWPLLAAGSATPGRGLPRAKKGDNVPVIFKSTRIYFLKAGSPDSPFLPLARPWGEEGLSREPGGPEQLRFALPSPFQEGLSGASFDP